MKRLLSIGLFLLVISSSSFGQINCPPNLPMTLVGNTEYCIGSSGAQLSISQSYDLYEWLPTAQTGQSVLLTAGSYQVAVTHYTGCVDTLDFEVEQVSNPPQPVINADGPLQFCQGESVVLSAPSGYPYYEWNSGSISDEITVFESGTFTISITDWLGCVSSSNAVQVIVDPLPVAAFSPDLNLFNIEFNNLSLFGDSYEWYFGDGSTSMDFEPAYTYTSEGLHSIYLVAYNDCGSDTAFLELASVGVSVHHLPKELKIFPNPSSGIIAVDFSTTTGKGVFIEVFDKIGRKVWHDQIMTAIGYESILLDFSYLPAGTYTLVLINDEQRHACPMFLSRN